VPVDPLLVRGDSGALAQVVDNLLTNARVHTPPGTVVSVQLSAADEGAAPVARLTVADDGPGIPAELLPEAFERFTRGDTSRSRAAGSSGLGLAIVAAVVEAHHGGVDVTSEPGRTEFTISIPRYTEPIDGFVTHTARTDST
jgi:two-component system OmpR family sensor kinase